MNLKINAPPIPSVSRETLDWAKHAGQIAGTEGRPPMVPAEFSVAAAAWHEGWKAGSQRLVAWRELKIDYEWKDRDV